MRFQDETIRMLHFQLMITHKLAKKKREKKADEITIEYSQFPSLEENEQMKDFLRNRRRNQIFIQNDHIDDMETFPMSFYLISSATISSLWKQQTNQASENPKSIDDSRWLLNDIYSNEIQLIERQIIVYHDHDLIELRFSIDSNPDETKKQQQQQNRRKENFWETKKENFIIFARYSFEIHIRTKSCYIYRCFLSMISVMKTKGKEREIDRESGKMIETVDK